MTPEKRVGYQGAVTAVSALPLLFYTICSDHCEQR